MELLKHINAVVSTFVEQNCLFSDINYKAFHYRVKSISQEIPEEFITDIYARLTENEILDKKNLRQVSVSSSIKIVGMTKKFAALANPAQKIELICFLVFLSERVLTFNRQVLEIIKVVSSILITREEDFKTIHEMMYTKKYPAISDRAFTYLSSEPIPLDILITQSNIIPLNRPREIYGIYKLYSYENLFLFWYRVNNEAGQPANVVNVYNANELSKGLLAGFDVQFDIEERDDKKLPSNYIKYLGNENEPTVILDEDLNELYISGASMPFSAFSFYQPILKWIERFRIKKPTRFTLHLELDFFDTQSSKMLLETMRKALELREVKVEVVYNWYTFDDDIDMVEAGREYATILDREFNFISKISEDQKQKKYE